MDRIAEALNIEIATPEEARIAKEEETDFTLEGRLKKHKGGEQDD